MKVLSIDPGEKRIGIAISDPTGTLARPFTIINHISLLEDARRIVNFANDLESKLMIIGYPLQSDGQIGYRARKSIRLKEQIQKLTDVTVILWDESFTTKQAHALRINMGLAKKKRNVPVDDLAAAILLEEFLSSNQFLELKETDNE